jgi:uncharacterized protein (UPF0332 family)
MSVKWEEFQKFAKEELTSDEFTRRNQISRAYYGAYHSSCAYFKFDNDVITDEKSHSKLINSLVLNIDKPKKKIGFKLQQLKSLRHKSDYDLDSNVTEGDLITVLSEMDKVINLLV